ncbi:MAG: DUF6538 domain-containing protein [Stellaceae bacterium]
MNRQTLYLQMWHGYWRVRKPVPKLLIPIIGKGQYLTRSLRTANFNEAKRLAPAVLAEFNNIIEQARLRFERAACRDATLAELAHLDTLDHDELLRKSPAVLGNLFQRLDLDPRQAPGKGSKVVPFKTVISEWARERKVAPPGERSYTAKAERFVAFIREHHRAADADDMARVSPEEPSTSSSSISGSCPRPHGFGGLPPASHAPAPPIAVLAPDGSRNFAVCNDYGTLQPSLSIRPYAAARL